MNGNNIHRKLTWAVVKTAVKRVTCAIAANASAFAIAAKAVVIAAVAVACVACGMIEERGVQTRVDAGEPSEIVFEAPIVNPATKAANCAGGHAGSGIGNGYASVSPATKAADGLGGSATPTAKAGYNGGAISTTKAGYNGGAISTAKAGYNGGAISTAKAGYNGGANPATKAPVAPPKNVIYGTNYPKDWSFMVAAVKYSGNFSDAGNGWVSSGSGSGSGDPGSGSGSGSGSGDPGSGSGSGSGSTLYFSQSEMSYKLTAEAEGWAGGKIWPAGGFKLAFCAYSPVLNTGSYDGATIDHRGVHIQDYALAIDGTQREILYSDRVVDQTKLNFTHGTAYPGGVQIQFKHALSCLVFNAKLASDNSGAEIKLTSIKLKNVKNKGTFKQNLEASSIGNDATHVAEWVIQPTEPVVSYDNILDAGGAQLTDNLLDLRTNNYAKDLVVMPQLFGDAEIEIIYSIRSSTSGQAINQTKTVRLDALIYKENDETLTGYNSFEMGKKYVYNVEIGLQKIRFQPVVISTTELTIIP